MDFKLATADLGGGVSRVDVVGEVDLSTAPELKEALGEVIDAGARGVLVDLSDATFIDSTTLGVLMGAVKRLRPAGGELTIVCRDPNIRKIFEITLLDRIFNIFETVDEGVAQLRKLEDDPQPEPSSRI
jgi:anti-sigma B factor antagonist